MENNLANRIKNKRKELEMTQQDLANKLGISLMTVLRWEKNERTPNTSMLPKLAEALNTSVEYLIGLENTLLEKTEIIQSLTEKEPKNKINMAYWGGVVDNVQNLASSGDKDKIISVAFMLKNALSSLLNKAGVNEKGIQNFYLSNNNIFNSVFGQGTTV